MSEFYESLAILIWVYNCAKTKDVRTKGIKNRKDIKAGKKNKGHQVR